MIPAYTKREQPAGCSRWGTLWLIQRASVIVLEPLHPRKDPHHTGRSIVVVRNAWVEPDPELCVAGPYTGRHLIRLESENREGAVFVDVGAPIRDKAVQPF